MSDVEADPTALSTESLLTPTDPTLALDANQILSEAIRPQIGEFEWRRWRRVRPRPSSARGWRRSAVSRSRSVIRNSRWSGTPPPISICTSSSPAAPTSTGPSARAKNGELDVDDTDGFGPENIYWLDPDVPEGQKVKGQGPPGTYHWYVLYYGGPGGFGDRNAPPTRWKVRVKHAGRGQGLRGTAPPRQ